MRSTMDQKYIQIAKDYKKNIAGHFVLVEGAKLRQRIDGKRIAVTRKIDGHLQVLLYEDGNAFMFNSSGKQNVEKLKCLESFSVSLNKAGISSAIIAAELYYPAPSGRPRCSDVISALADPKKKEQLCLAPFDIIELNGAPWKAEHYADTHSKLCTIFMDNQVRPVQMRNAASVSDVQEIYDEWVTDEGAEGLVVHSESPIIWKVKPRHTIDAAIIGYTTADRGIRDLMMSVRRQDGLFQMFALGSNGLSDDDRSSLVGRLKKMHVESQYVLSDSRGIAYQMVKPVIVFELSVIELVSRGNDNKIKTNPLLRYDDSHGWLAEGATPGVSAQGVVFEKERTDKQPSETDIRVSQLSDLCPFEEPEGCPVEMKPSIVLERCVYKKVSGEKTMIHKFLLWKTNKEQTGRYPAYIVYHTDYSSGRKDMIKRDMLYSNDEKQARGLLSAKICDNIKKGWEEISK